MIKISMIFPGHGLQNINFLKKIYKNNNIFKKTFSKASNILNYNLWENFLKNKYCKNEYFSQLEIFTISISLYKLWKKKIGIRPYVMTGHSLGQYSALVCSGVLNFSDALKIISYRQKLMRNKIGKMYAIIGLNKKIVKNICKDFGKKKVFIACINSNNQIIVTGKKKYLKKISNEFKKNGSKKIIHLPMKHMCHCPLMKNIKDNMLNKFYKINFNRPKNFVIDSTLVKFLNKPKKIKYALFNQICKTVYWNETIDLLLSKKIKYFLEMNTGNFLTKLSDKKKKYYPLKANQIFI
jgi:[acyl-carrier-protein] S-malonyltransferase